MPDSGKQSAKVFILTGEWQDIRGKNVLKFVGTSDDLGTVELIFPTIPYSSSNANLLFPTYQFLTTEKKLSLKSFDEKKVDALYFNTQRDLKNGRRRTWKEWA
ncbi:MAG: hypothetical protein MZV63_56755 [Marinilabiliales bacterium]|nr:hypothetical protein [Marinilabiliales bacterium]